MKQAYCSVLVLAALAAGCGTNPLTRESEVNFYGIKEEAGLGYELAPSIEAEMGGLYEDKELQEYVNRVTLRMAQSAPVMEEGVRFQYRGRVLNSPVVNAFSLPGGPVYITRGLMVRLNNEAELASVLGHEVAHIAGRHGTNRISEAQLTQALLAVGIVGGGLAAGEENVEYVAGAAVVATAIGSLYILGHSRDHEYQSDEFGADFAWRNGYDPRHLAEVFRTFKKVKSEGGGDDLPEFLQTHPKDDKRIAELERHWGTKYASAAPGRTYQNNEGPYKNAISGLQKDAPALAKYDKGRALMGQKKWAQAVGELDEAIKLAPHYSFTHEARGRCLAESGRDGQARDDFQRAIQINPDNAAAQKGLGLALARTGDAAGASQAFSSAVKLDPLDPDARLGLAAAMEKQGRKKEPQRHREAAARIREGRMRGRLR